MASFRERAQKYKDQRHRLPSQALRQHQDGLFVTPASEQEQQPKKRHLEQGRSGEEQVKKRSFQHRYFEQQQDPVEAEQRLGQQTPALEEQRERGQAPGLSLQLRHSGFRELPESDMQEAEQGQKEQRQMEMGAEPQESIAIEDDDEVVFIEARFRLEKTAIEVSDDTFEQEVCKIYGGAFDQLAKQLRLRPKLKLKAQLEDVATATVSRGLVREIKRRDAVNLKVMKVAINAIEDHYERLEEVKEKLELTEDQRKFESTILSSAKARMRLAQEAGDMRANVVEDIKTYLRLYRPKEAWE